MKRKFLPPTSLSVVRPTVCCCQPQTYVAMAFLFVFSCSLSNNAWLFYFVLFTNVHSCRRRAFFASRPTEYETFEIMARVFNDFSRFGRPEFGITFFLYSRIIVLYCQHRAETFNAAWISVRHLFHIPCFLSVSNFIVSNWKKSTWLIFSLYFLVIPRK